LDFCPLRYGFLHIRVLIAGCQSVQHRSKEIIQSAVFSREGTSII